MKYEVIRDCYGFKGRYWAKGEVVDLTPSENPPEHFKSLEPVAEVVESSEVKEKPAKKGAVKHAKHDVDSASSTASTK